MGQMAGIEDCYTSAKGSTGTLGNLPRQPTPPLPRPTATLPPTSGRRPSSQSLPTRSSQTSWRRTTALLGFRSRRLGLTNQLKMEADGEEMKIIFVQVLRSHEGPEL